MGRLSNPPESLETLTPQGIRGIGRSGAQRSKQAIHSPTGSESDVQETPGRLSNPRPTILRRLSDIEIDRMVSAYRTGRSLADLARELGIHPRTVAEHLNTRRVPLRVNRRKMSDHDVSDAARRYCSGDSLVTVALTLNVNAATVRREFHRAGITVRPRPGWHRVAPGLRTP